MISITQGRKTAQVQAFKAGMKLTDVTVVVEAAGIYERLRKRANRARGGAQNFGYWRGFKDGVKESLSELVEAL